MEYLDKVTDKELKILKAFREDQEKMYRCNKEFTNIIIILATLLLLTIFCIEHLTDVRETTKLKFCHRAKWLCFCSLFFYIGTLLLNSQFDFLSRFSFTVINNVLIDFMLLTCAGSFRTYNIIQDDLLIIFLGAEVFIRAYLSINIFQSYRLMKYLTTIVFIYNSILLVCVHNKVNNSVINYFITKLILLLLINVITYIREQTLFKDYIAQYNNKEERDYYYNILDSMNVGLFIYKDSAFYYNKLIKEMNDNYQQSAILNSKENIFNEGSSVDIRNGSAHIFCQKNENKPIMNDNTDIFHIKEYINQILINGNINIDQTNIYREILEEHRKNEGNVIEKSFDLFLNKLIDSKSHTEKFHKIINIKLFLNSEAKFFDVSLRSYNLNDDKSIEIIISDVTSIVMVEGEIMRNKFKGMTLAKIAHELKSPINTICLLVKNLMSENKTDDNIRKKSKPIQACKDHEDTNSLHSDSTIKDEDDLNMDFDIKAYMQNSNLNNISTTTNNKFFFGGTVDVGGKKKKSIFKFDSDNEEKEEKKENIFEKLRFIDCIGEYLIMLIEDLNFFVKSIDPEMDMKDKTKFELQDVNINSVLNFCYNIFDTKQKNDLNKKNLKIIKSFDPYSPSKIKTNSTKLKQVIINIMSNAYKFTPFGEVRLVTKVLQYSNKHYLRISIEDTGEGLKEEELSLIFSPWTKIQRNQKLNNFGSGLGLSICKDILEQFGSNIHVESTYLKGCTFYFDLEYEPKELVRPRRLVSSIKTDQNSIETLTVDNQCFINEDILNELIGRRIRSKFYLYIIASRYNTLKSNSDLIRDRILKKPSKKYVSHQNFNSLALNNKTEEVKDEIRDIEEKKCQSLTQINEFEDTCNGNIFSK